MEESHCLAEKAILKIPLMDASHRYEEAYHLLSPLLADHLSSSLLKLWFKLLPILLLGKKLEPSTLSKLDKYQTFS